MIVTMLHRFTDYAIKRIRIWKQRRVFMISSGFAAIATIAWFAWGIAMHPQYDCLGLLLRLFGW